MRYPLVPAIFLLILGTSFRTALAQVAVIDFPAVQVGPTITANNESAMISVDGSFAEPFDQTVSCAIQEPGPGGWALFGLVFLHADTGGTLYGTAGIAGLPALAAVPHQRLYGCWAFDGTSVNLRITTSELGCASPAMGNPGDFNGDGTKTVGDMFLAVERFCEGRMSLAGLWEFLLVYLG